jgi:hypothetical protein
MDNWRFHAWRMVKTFCMPCTHGSFTMAHGQNILHALDSWLIHHGAWSKHFACPAFMAQEMDGQQQTSMIRNTATVLSSTAHPISMVPTSQTQK